MEGGTSIEECPGDIVMIINTRRPLKLENYLFTNKISCNGVLGLTTRQNLKIPEVLRDFYTNDEFFRHFLVLFPNEKSTRKACIIRNIKEKLRNAVYVQERKILLLRTDQTI